MMSADKLVHRRCELAIRLLGDKATDSLKQLLLNLVWHKS